MTRNRPAPDPAHRSTRLRLSAVLLALVAALVAALGPQAAAVADAPGDDVLPFYTAPATLPPANGVLIRTERLTYLLDPAGLADVAATSTRMLYRTTDREGVPIAVSGSVIVPKAPWVGLGKRPVIGYAVGTQGVGDSCAPSRQFTDGIEYESIVINGLLARGYAVAVTDYEGLGTAGPHTYMDRLAQGHAVLDSVRAAQRLPGSGLSATSPVGIYGYSQGGGAAAAAAELAGGYAPELRLRGTVAGAVPADLTVLPDNLDGSLYAEFLWFALTGLSASYDVDLNPYFNDAGRDLFAQISDDCVFDLFTTSFKHSSDYSADGRSFAQLIQQQPFASILADQRIGRIKPSAPVLVSHSVLDDVIPYRTGKQLAKDWCARGANVRFSTNAVPLHVGGMVPAAAEAFSFFEARFAGLPAISNCWAL